MKIHNFRTDCGCVMKPHASQPARAFPRTMRQPLTKSTRCFPPFTRDSALSPGMILQQRRPIEPPRTPSLVHDVYLRRARLWPLRGLGGFASSQD
jgi:hypothetical protein